jgi:penicillin-binding protein 2
MDPKTGALLALASYPTYNPTVWVKQGKPLQWLLNPNNAAHPQFDRATQGQYPPGSTFKPFTAASGYEAGLIGTNTHLLCSGTYTSPIDQSKTVFKNWDTGISAVIDLPKALEISCDSFFYRIGNAFYERYTHASEQFPVELRKFGFGAAPPIDITGAALGVVPDPQWKERTFTDPIERLWSPGDDINMSIGQGNLLVSPLQLATAYSAVATDGTLPTPHVVSEATDPSGHTKHFHFQPQRHLALSSTFLDEVRQGLIGASHASDGTSTSVFGSFLPEVAGKTGTAEAPPKDPNAWYACWAPADDPKIVVVVLIANGGHGGVAAAPAAREVLQAYFHPNTHTTLVHGTDTSH